jgi:ribonucleoside-diphosphate reductase alpha chain
MNLNITRRDGTKEPFDADRINRALERASKGLPDVVEKVIKIASEMELTIYDGITEEEIDEATINTALQNIKDDPDYDKIATRLLLKTVYKRILGDYPRDNPTIIKEKHVELFPKYIRKGVDDGLLDKRMTEKFNLEELAKHLDTSRDELLQYSGLSTLLHRYSLKDINNISQETPQFFFMRVAMGLSYNENDPNLWAKKFYDKLSRLEYLPGGSTNLMSGTVRPAMSNCFLIEMQDDMEHIAKSVADVLMISKATGGLGVSVTKLRATGSRLASSNTVSSGPTPFAKIMDVAVRAVQRGGKKKGALCFYMENWHYDFPDFIEWKHNAGEDNLRMRTANTAAFISDEFMKRVKAHEPWYMFDPKETPDLIELYGEAFSKRYAEYVTMAEEGKLNLWRKMPAETMMRNMLVSLQGTSHPWLTWKDPMNLRALNNNTGTIHMSNLCTEIALPQDRDNIAVCNLASISLPAHLNSNKTINWQKFEETIRTGIRHLDNLIDINLLPVKEAIKSDQENRAVGLGLMGFADAIERLGYAYDSEESYNLADQVFEFLSYIAIDESTELAKTRGAYKNFPGSEWSKGLVPIDTLSKLEKERGVTIEIDKESKHGGLNWDTLREKVKGGIRNATLMAIAPNANIGLVAGTTPGIDVRFTQAFSRNKISGKYLDINHSLVKDLKKLNIWERVRGEIIQNQGDISSIALIPDELKEIYKTSFSTSAYGVIEVAARAQKWVDQAISRNMYLETRDIDETMNIYTAAWEKGIKSTYYLHMKPRHTAEQSTVAVNKAKAIGKVGFANIWNTKETVAPAMMQANPIDEEAVLVKSNNTPDIEDPGTANVCISCE